MPMRGHLMLIPTDPIGRNAVADPYAAYLLYDLFTGIDATHVHDHTPNKAPVGSVWADVDGANAWTINSNKATCSGGPDQSIEIDTGAANLSIVLASVVPGNYFAILARGDATSLDYVMGQIQTAENLLQIAYHDGSYHALANVAYVVDPTDTISNFEFRVNGTALEIRIDGVSKVSTISSYNLTNTQVGLYGYNESGVCTVDGLSVTAL
ncbi:hypothetical protein KKF61_07760 [Patescibacteria group bacterium]|nr:hypothetical protein [Patescibacteria group bacterium]